MSQIRGGDGPSPRNSNLAKSCWGRAVPPRSAVSAPFCTRALKLKAGHQANLGSWRAALHYPDNEQASARLARAARCAFNQAVNEMALRDLQEADRLFH